MSSDDNEHKEFVDDWMSRIRAGIDFRKKYSSRSEWDSYRNMYRNKFPNGQRVINKIFSYGRMLVPKVYFQAPRVSITALRPDLVWHAKVVETIDNMLIKQLFVKKAMKMGALDSYLCGTGPIKLGFDSEFGYAPEQAITNDGETGTQIGEKEGELIEYQIGVQPGMPWAIRVRPEDVVVPWGSVDSDSLPWIAHYILRPLDDIKEDSKYDKKAREKLVGTRTPGADNRKSAMYRPREQRDKDVVFGELWEIRDFKRKQIVTLCENRVLLAMDDALQDMCGNPWEFIQFNPDPEYFWAISDAGLLVPHQEELNDNWTQENRHRQIALLKFLYKRGAIKPDELDKFMSGEVGPGVAVDGDDPLGSAIMPFQPHVPYDFRVQEKAIIDHMQEALGYSPNQVGQFSPYHGKTAAESKIVESSFEARSDERKDIMADVLLGIVQKWNQMIFSLWTQEKVVQITTPMGEPYWIKYTGDQLRGQYLLTTDIDSGMPFTHQMKFQIQNAALQEFNGDPMVDQVELRRMVLEAYSAVDPRYASLLKVPPNVDPQQLAAMRSPHPRGAGSGGQSSQQGPGQGMGAQRHGKAPGANATPLEALQKGGQQHALI